MTSLLESEVKIFVPDLNAVAAQVQAAGAVLTAQRVFERNIRYEDTAQSFTSRGIVLRLRQDTRVRLTYKSAPPDGPGVTADGVQRRFEAEVTVDDLDTMDLILQRLGFQPFVVYEKYRTTYELGGTEIALDEMPYGDFVEVEGPEAAIESTLAALGLQDAPRLVASYLMLFEHVKTQLGLTIRDLTFDDFKQVWVPDHVFTHSAITNPGKDG